MIPKIIHLCWFSNDKYPVEIRACLDTWKRVLPDYTIRLWDYAAARAIGCRFIDEALEKRKWAFAADAVRFYAVLTEGGVYMDSDIFLFQRFDKYIPQNGFTTFCENDKGEDSFGLQAAFFIGEKGNEFCRRMFEHYNSQPFVDPDGSLNDTISPMVMRRIADNMGFEGVDREQHLPGLNVYPTRLVMPRKRYERGADTIAMHRVYGSWRKRKLSRAIELRVNHILNVIRYTLFHKI